MKKRTKTNLKIIGATSVCIFSLTTLFTTTIAWFSSNRTVDTSGMSVRVSMISRAFSSMTVHRCDLSLSTSSTLHFYSEPVVAINNVGAMVETGDLHMDNYSTLNQTQPVLFLFTLETGTYEDDVNIVATSDNAYFTNVITAQNVANFPFSSASAFKSASYSSNNFPFDNVVISDYSTTTTFVEIDGQNTPTYHQSISLFEGTSHTAVKYVAVILDYYADAIEYIKNLPANANYVSIAESNNNSIGFYCDWILEM